ncbi:hypothetical protein MAHJHV63_50250 [Mycobacterium avium subsp. hominissuis]
MVRPASLSMAGAVMPYVSWLTAVAEQCGRAAAQATAAARPHCSATAVSQET